MSFSRVSVVAAGLVFFVAISSPVFSRLIVSTLGMQEF
jgi:hypothetical protein